MYERKIDQGTVIYGIRSEKYPTTVCYGIIVTARCDIAQEKVPKYYYVVGVEAKTWLITSCGYHVAYEDVINGKRDAVKMKAAALGLDGDTLVGWEDNKVDAVLKNVAEKNPGDRKHTNAVKNLRTAINEYHIYSKPNMADADRKKAICSNKKPAITCIRDIDLGKKLHFYYLPEDAYLANGNKGKGIVVDLLEIDTISLEDIKRICSAFCTNTIIHENLPKIPELGEIQRIIHDRDERALHEVFQRFNEYQRMTNKYWLEEDDSFVDIDGTIQSPWCEHLMQRFSNAFTRIGIDNPTNNDYENVVSQIEREESK